MKFKNLIQKIFSITNKDKHKVITFLFVKMKFKMAARPKPCVVVVDPGGIGDYMFCRPYFKYIKQSPKYKNCKLVYLTRNIHEYMTRCYDMDSVDSTISYDGNLYKNNKNYRKYILKKINSLNIKSLINLRCIALGIVQDSFSRHDIVKHINAKRKITEVIDFTDGYDEPQLKCYNQVISTTSRDDFELERRRKFFEKLLEISIPDETIQVEPLINFNKSYIAISIMATAKSRCFSDLKWKKVLDYLLNSLSEDAELLFLGSYSEKGIINKLIKTLNKPDKCKNLAGKFPVSVIPLVLSRCNFLLSVESGNVHIAQAVNCKTICLSNGAYYKHYHPWKNGLVEYIYPKSFENFLENASEKDLEILYNFNKKFQTNDIEVDDVIRAIDKYLSDCEKSRNNNVFGGG